MDRIDVDPLPAAVLAAEQHARAGGMRSPCLFALVAADSDGDYDVIPQPELPAGPLEIVLMWVTWPDQVVGCVSVTDLTISDDEDGAGRQVKGRLAVGATRDKQYAACLRYDGADGVLVGAEVNALAQGVVGALVGTFL